MLNVNSLRAEMVRNGYTQKSLSAAIGISSRSFSNKCKSGVFGSDEIEKIVELLKLETPCDIFFAKK